MPRFLEGITFIDGSGEEVVINSKVPLQRTTSNIDGASTYNTLPLRDNTNRFQVGNTDVSSTDGYIVMNKNYVDGRVSIVNQEISAEATARQNKDSSLEIKINSLDYSDTAADNRKYVSKVTQTNGQIAVTHVNFSDAKATGSSYGFIKTGYTNDTTNKNYAVKLNNNGDAYVNVPGSAYSNGAGLNLSGTSFSLNRTSTTNNTNYSIYFGATNTGAVCYNNSKLTFNPSSGLLKATKMQCNTEPTSSTDVIRKAELDIVNTRLNSLGFKRAVVYSQGSSSNEMGIIKKNGNYVLFTPSGVLGSSSVIHDDFKPIGNRVGRIRLSGTLSSFSGSDIQTKVWCNYEITSEGTVTLSTDKSISTFTDYGYGSISLGGLFSIGYGKNDYIKIKTVANTSLISLGNSETLVLEPLDIDWGDGYRTQYVYKTNGSITHSYATPGSYEIIIGGLSDTSIYMGYNTAIEEVEIGGGISLINSGVFVRCSNLTSITIPNSVTNIGTGAIRDCTSLTGIIIPNSVTSIGNYALAYCRNLNNIVFNGTKTQWEAVTKGENWHIDVPTSVIHCTDGSTPI